MSVSGTRPLRQVAGKWSHRLRVLFSDEYSRSHPADGVAGSARLAITVNVKEHDQTPGPEKRGGDRSQQYYYELADGLGHRALWALPGCVMPARTWDTDAKVGVRARKIVKKVTINARTHYHSGLNKARMEQIIGPCGI